LYIKTAPPNPQKLFSTVGLNIGAIDVNGYRFLWWDLGGKHKLSIS
jgi:hypothetical protein